MVQTKKIEGKIVQDNGETIYGVWSRMLITRAKMCSRDENIETNAVKLEKIEIQNDST